MIHLIGLQESPEGEAAKALLSSIVRLWPDLPASESEKISVAIGAKVFGSAVQDLDVVMCMVGHRRVFQPLRPVRCRPNDFVVTRDLRVDSFVVAVEVKGH